MTENVVSNITQEDIQQTKSLAWLSYLGILFLIPMLVNKDSAYTKFHVNQGILLFILELCISVLSFIFGWILPFLAFIPSLLGVVTFVLMILGIVNACKGEAKPLPIIGNIRIYK